MANAKLKIVTVCALLLPLLSGCAASPKSELPAGPAGFSLVRQEAWVFPGTDSARKIITPHYVLYTTIQSDDILDRLSQLVEGGYAQYQQLVPCLKLTDEPLACYLFENRKQWAQFTKLHAGDDARIYLQINRGGYTAGDKYVAYFIGDLGTYSVAAHEGWHQFLGRHFKTRPPPFLEEGLATLFEDVQWEGDLPRWNLWLNSARLTSLRRTAAQGKLIPLGDLCTIHAGDVVDKSSVSIEGFYAQCWAFARFCREAGGGKFRPGLEKLLCDCANDTAYPPAPGATPGTWHWDKNSAKPLLERYLGEDMATLDREYRDYIAAVLASARPPDEPPG